MYEHMHLYAYAHTIVVGEAVESIAEGALLGHHVGASLGHIDGASLSCLLGAGWAVGGSGSGAAHLQVVAARPTPTTSPSTMHLPSTLCLAFEWVSMSGWVPARVVSDQIFESLWILWIVVDIADSCGYCGQLWSVVGSCGQLWVVVHIYA